MLTALLAACGTESEEAEPTVTRVDVAGAPPTRTPTVPGAEQPSSPVAQESPAGTPADGGDGGQTAGGPIEVDMVELAFNPAELTIPANTDVTIHAVNAGALPHTFTLPDQGIDTGEVASGASADVTVNLPPGEYRYICTVPGHADGGMVGTLIVE